MATLERHLSSAKGQGVHKMLGIAYLMTQGLLGFHKHNPYPTHLSRLAKLYTFECG
jgi:hypothetical protein